MMLGREAGGAVAQVMVRVMVMVWVWVLAILKCGEVVMGRWLLM